MLVQSWLSVILFDLETEKTFRFEGKKVMFTIPPNTILIICAAIFGAIIGFVIYGCIKGFENIFPGA